MLRFKYDLTQAEPVVMDLPAVNDTFAYGEALKVGSAEAGGVESAGVGTGKFAGVSNEAATLSGTQAAGTLGFLKVIVNPFAVYAVPYDDSGRITWGTVTDTSIPFTCANNAGFANLGGGWAWSYDTGRLDYVVSSAVASTTCTLTTVTGTNTASDYGILLQPAGSLASCVLELNADALSIDADQVDVGVAGTNGLTAVIIANVLESRTHGVEILKASVHNQKVRTMNALSTGADKAIAYAYACFSPYSNLV